MKKRQEKPMTTSLPHRKGNEKETRRVRELQAPFLNQIPFLRQLAQPHLPIAPPAVEVHDSRLAWKRIAVPREARPPASLLHRADESHEGSVTEQLQNLAAMQEKALGTDEPPSTPAP